MRSPSPLRALVPSALVLGLVASTGTARALDDCPPGSSARSENGFTWCEPSVCANDGSCRPDEVCRPVALCVQVGTVNPSGAAVGQDAGAKLVATGRCGPDKKCPDTTVCSDLGRCLAKTTADKMGILAPASSAAPASSSAAGSGGKSCGCSVPGAGGALGSGLGAFGALGLLATIRLRRRR